MWTHPLEFMASGSENWLNASYTCIYLQKARLEASRLFRKEEAKSIFRTSSAKNYTEKLFSINRLITTYIQKIELQNFV